MAVHIAYVKPTPVLNGQVIDKNTAKIAEVMKSDTEMRIVPDTTIPNSSGSPSIKEYIEAEEGAGFKLISLSNTAVVTSDA